MIQKSTLDLPESKFNVPLPPLKNYKYHNKKKSITEEEKKEEENLLNELKADQNPEEDMILIDKESEEKMKINALRGNIIETLETQHYFWECTPKDIKKLQVFQNNKEFINPNVYKFKLFESEFDESTNVPTINLPVYTFRSKREKLNKEQIHQLWKSRTFQVESEMKDLPHTWQVTPCLLNSSKGKNSFMLRTFAVALRLLYCIPNSWNCCGERVLRYRPTKSITKPNILNVFMCLFFFFLNLLDFFFGIRFRVLNYNYSTRVDKRILAKIKDNFKQTQKEFPKMNLLIRFLRRKNTVVFSHQRKNEQVDDQKKEMTPKKFKSSIEEIKYIEDFCTKLDKKFETYLDSEIQKELDKEDYDEKEVDDIQNKFKERKQEMYIEFVKTQREDCEFPEIFDVLYDLLQAQVIYNSYEAELAYSVQEKQSTLYSDFRRNRKVFARIKHKMRKIIEKQVNKFKADLKEKCNSSIINELREKGLFEQSELFLRFLDYKKNYDKLFKSEIEIERKENMRSINKFKPKYPLRHDQWVVKQSKNPLIYYYAESYQGYITITSRYFFYKVTKAIVTYFLKIYSICFYLLKYCWDGKFGIRGLFCCTDFFRNYSVDQKTGEILKNQTRVRPFLRKFLGVIHGIQKSRKRFETRPDDGFFGKGMGRLCNLIECGIIRFFFFGIIGILIIHPIINIIVIIMCIVLSLTSIIWLLPIEIILLIFKLLIYDYKSTLRGGNHYKYNPDYFFESRILKYVRSYRFFTLFRLIFDLIINVPIQLVMVFLMIIVNPIIALLIIILAGIVYIIKNVLDWIVIRIIIGPCARVPSSNTGYAKRIKGPGISRDFYCSIESEHLSLLVLSYLETLRLRQLQKETIARLEYPSKHIQEHTDKVLDEFSPAGHQNKFIIDSIKNLEYLKKSLNYLVDYRIRKLPKITGGKYTVRFTEESLKKNLNVVIGILSEVLEQHNMDYYIWENYKIKKGHFNKLSRAIFSEVLTPSALIPVEAVDRVNKIKYNKTKVVDYVSKVIDDNESKMKKEARMKRVWEKQKYHKSMNFVSLKYIFEIQKRTFISWSSPFVYPYLKEYSVMMFSSKIKSTKTNVEDENKYVETTIKDTAIIEIDK